MGVRGEAMEASPDSIALKPSWFSIWFLQRGGLKAFLEGEKRVPRRTMLARFEPQTRRTKRSFLRDRRRWPGDGDEAEGVSRDTDGAASGAVLMRHAGLKTQIQAKPGIRPAANVNQRGEMISGQARTRTSCLDSSCRPLNPTQQRNSTDLISLKRRPSLPWSRDAGALLILLSQIFFPPLFFFCV